MRWPMFSYDPGGGSIKQIPSQTMEFLSVQNKVAENLLQLCYPTGANKEFFRCLLSDSITYARWSCSLSSDLQKTYINMIIQYHNANS